MVPMRIRPPALPVRQCSRPRWTYTGSSKVAPSCRAAEIHQAEEAAAKARNHSQSQSRSRRSPGAIDFHLRVATRSALKKARFPGQNRVVEVPSGEKLPDSLPSANTKLTCPAQHEQHGGCL